MLKKMFNMSVIGLLTGLIMTGCAKSDSTEKKAAGSPQPIDMNVAQAKDAMALNAIMYPLVVDISNLPICTENIAALQTCVDLLQLAAPTPPAGASSPTPGENLCTSGSFDYDKSGDTYTITFNNCVDDANKQKLHEDLVLKACGYGVDPLILPKNDTSTGTYNVTYNGSLTCSPYIRTATNYTYRTIGNSSGQTKMDWTYNGTVDLTSKVSITGNMRELAKYGDPSDTWDQLLLGSDEEWVFNNTSLTLGDTMTFDGRYSYIKHPNQSTVKPDPVGYTFYMDFKALSYALTHNGLDLDADVKGTVSASCHQDEVTYATQTILTDLNTTRDINDSRMPSAGEMSSTMAGFNPVPAIFGAPTTNAQVTITASNSDTVYNSWREVITGSSCVGIQDVMDKIKLPISPTPPTTPDHSDIIIENIKFAIDLAPTSGTVQPPVTGKADGHAVWYFVAPGHGYAADSTQKLSETYFDFNASFTNITKNGYVNVYLKDASGNNISGPTGHAGWSIHNQQEWSDLQTAHPNYTLRGDYIDVDWSTFSFIHGNFILRLGDNSYKGHDSFVINTYDVRKNTP